jgi:hypothetical protein
MQIIECKQMLNISVEELWRFLAALNVRIQEELDHKIAQSTHESE